MTSDTSLIIDINGETCKAVCVDKDKNPLQIKTPSGSLEIPTVLSFEKTRCLVGEQAIKNAEKNLSYTIFYLEQYLMSNRELYSKFPRFTDTVQYTESDDSRLSFSIVRNNTKINVYLEEAFSYLIAHLIELAKSATGAKAISKVVILTQFSKMNSKKCYDIDIYWRAQEILRTIGMGEKLEVLTIEKSFLYEREYIQSVAKKSSCVIFNFEYETFFLIYPFIPKYQAKFRSKIGGRDCESKLMLYCLGNLKDIRKNYEDINKKSSLAMYEIREACKKAIVKLSRQKEATIDFSIKEKNEYYRLSITREKFEELCHPIFKEIIDLLEKNYPLNNNQIYNLELLVLTGDIATFPKLEEMVVKFFQSRSKDIKVHKSELSKIFDLAYRYKKYWENAKPFIRARVKKYNLSIGYGTYWGFIERLFDTPLLAIPAQFSLLLLQRSNYNRKPGTNYTKIYEGKSILKEFNRHLITLTLPYISSDSSKMSSTILTVRLTEYGQIVLTSAEAMNPYNRTSVFIESQNQRYTPREMQTILRKAEDHATEERELIRSKEPLFRNFEKFSTMRKMLRHRYRLLFERDGVFESSTIEFKEQLAKEIKDAQFAYTSLARDVALEYFVQTESRIQRQFEEIEKRYLEDIQNFAAR